MPDTFVPLLPAKPKTVESAFNPMIGAPASGSIPQNAPEIKAAIVADTSKSPQNCGQPVISVERKDDMVSGIRIQCGCGKVIELTCIH